MYDNGAEMWAATIYSLMFLVPSISHTPTPYTSTQYYLLSIMRSTTITTTSALLLTNALLLHRPPTVLEK